MIRRKSDDYSQNEEDNKNDNGNENETRKLING